MANKTIAITMVNPAVNFAERSGRTRLRASKAERRRLAWLRATAAEEFVADIFNLNPVAAYVDR